MTIDKIKTFFSTSNFFSCDVLEGKPEGLFWNVFREIESSFYLWLTRCFPSSMKTFSTIDSFSTFPYSFLVHLLPFSVVMSSVRK